MNETRWRHAFHTPLGQMQAVSTKAGLLGLGFLEADGQLDPRLLSQAGVAAEIGDPQGVEERLGRWFQGDRTGLDGLQLDLQGTAFQRAVWTQLGSLAWGETLSYGALAGLLGRPTAARAVGAAVGRNPVAIVVPCHRVLGADGQMTGYAWGLSRKRWLLRHEGALPGPQQGALFGVQLLAG